MWVPLWQLPHRATPSARLTTCATSAAIGTRLFSDKNSGAMSCREPCTFQRTGDRAWRVAGSPAQSDLRQRYSPLTVRRALAPVRASENRELTDSNGPNDGRLSTVNLASLPSGSCKQTNQELNGKSCVVFERQERNLVIQLLQKLYECGTTANGYFAWH